MVTYNLKYELSGDSNNTGGYSTFSMIFNGITLTQFMSPVDIGHPPGVPQWGLCTRDVTGIFDPTINNELVMGYTGEGGDFGNGRYLRVEGSDGSLYYGEYPISYPYSAAEFDAGGIPGGLEMLYGRPSDGKMHFGDGDFPPYEWNAQTKTYDSFPVDSHGVSSGLAHFFFTIPDVRSGWGVGQIRGS